MPLILSQEIGPTGITIVTSGKPSVTFTVTYAQILARHNLETGNVATKKSKVLTWMRTGFTAVGGDAVVDPNKITIDYDSVTGRVTQLEIES